MEPFIGQIMMFGGNFAPRGWAMCDGQLLSIPEHSALFSILGTTYGGDGKSTFGLPDLRSRSPMHVGQGPGLSNRPLGSKLGTEKVTLKTSEMPAHNHGVSCQSTQGTLPSPVSNYLGADRTGADDLYAASADDSMNAGMIQSTGGGGAHDNMHPCQVVNFVIALVGIFPSRN